MNNSLADQKSHACKCLVKLLAVFIVFTGFAKVAHAQLSESECDAKNTTLAKQADQASKADDPMHSTNAAYSKYYKSLIELYEGSCSQCRVGHL